MDTNTLLIILVVLLLLGGGWFGRGRWYWQHPFWSRREIFRKIRTAKQNGRAFGPAIV